MLLEPHLLQTFAHCDSTIRAKGVAEQKVHIKEQLLSEFFHDVASTGTKTCRRPAVPRASCLTVFQQMCVFKAPSPAKLGT